MVRSGFKIYVVASLVALAVVLKFYEIPYPPAPFLKYDVSGIPLAVIALMTLRSAYSVLPIYYAIPVLVGSDPIGMAMKCLAETATFTPLVLATRRFRGKLEENTLAVIAVALATTSRVAIMALANYVVTPYWLIWAGWVKSMEKAYELVVYYMPHIVLFNLTISLIVAPATIVVYRVLSRTGFLR